MDTVRKSTAQPAGENPLIFVMSDASVDRMGDVIEPNGWVLRNFKNNPMALFNHDTDMPIGRWKNVRVESDQLIGELEFGPEGACPITDKMRSFVAAGMMRAVSVGFRPLTAEPIDGSRGGIRYKAAELMECSLVSIPANPNALAVAKSLNLSDDVRQLVFGKSAVETSDADRRGASGETAATPPHRKTGPMTTLSERIDDAKNELVRLKDALTDHIKADDADEIVTGELADKIEKQEATVANLERAEKALATKTAARPEEAAPASAAAARRPFAAVAKKSEPRDLIVRAAAVNLLAHATGRDVETVLEQRYGSDDGTAMVVKAAVAGATTTQSGWAAELVNTAMTDFLETLRPISVYPTLASAGGGRLAFGPNQGAIKIPSRAPTPSIAGSFVGEGAPIPVRRLGLQAITLSPKKMGVISVFSREIARYSTPAIEALVRQEIEADTALTIDTLLLDANAGSAVRPAGLLNGVTAITATTGGGAAAILGDIKKLRAAFTTANAGRNLVLLMNPQQSDALALTPGPDGTLGWADSILARYQVISSTTVPVGRVILIDAADFVSATGDTPEFELSNEATIHMEDTSPQQISAAGTPNVVAAPVQSMFQTAQIALRMLMDVSWAMRRSGMVAWIDGVTW